MDPNRMEERWNSRLEKYIKHMRNIADTQSHLHEQAGYHFKKRNNYFGLPSVLIPLIMAPVSLMLESKESSEGAYVNAAGFMITGIFTGIYSFFKYGEKMERHFSFSSRYSDIVTDIESELIKERSFRMHADVMIMKVKLSLDHLNNTAPVVPQKIIVVEEKENPKEEYDILAKNSKSSGATSESDQRMLQKPTTPEGLVKKPQKSQEKRKPRRKSLKTEKPKTTSDVKLDVFSPERRDSL